MQFIYSLLAILNEMSPYILLGFFIAGLLHVFVKPSLMAKHLSGNGIKPVIKSALFGIPLPLCSCGVLPTAVSLKRSGASNAATTSFLIATPQTGVDSIAATWSLLGPAMAVTRPIAALVCSVLGGVSVGKFDKNTENDIKLTHSESKEACSCCDDSATETQKANFTTKLFGAIRYGFVDMIQHVGKWLVIGLVVAALITVFVPDDLFVSLSRNPLLAMIAMVVVAVPMYICATGSIPIAMTLILKGLTPGVAFVMLMAGPAANFASVMVLRKSIGGKATAIYIASVALTAIAFGLIIDCLLPSEWFALPGKMAMACHEGVTFSWFPTICSALLLAFLVNAYYQTKKQQSIQISNDMESKTFKIEGMMCPHCQANVKKGIESLPGIEAVVVDLGKGTAEVSGDVPAETVIAKVEALGYEAKLI